MNDTEYKIFNMSPANFDEYEPDKALNLVYTYLTKKKKDDFLKNEKIYLFLVKEFANNYYSCGGINSKIWENVNISLKANAKLNDVINTLERTQDQDTITNYREIIKPVILKSLETITTDDKYFDNSKILDFLNTNPQALFCGAENFPDLFAQRIKAKAEDKNLYFTFKTFYNPATNEPCNVPKGTLNYICARPSAGKTTALISLMLESLEQNKKVIFITTEETPDSIYIKLIKAHFFSHNKNKYRNAWHEIIGSNTQKFFEKQLSIILNGEEIRPAIDTKEEILLCEIKKAIKESENEISKYFKNKSFLFSDACNYTSWNDTLEVMHKAGDGGIVFLDYIQHLPKMPIDKASLLLSSRLDQLRETSRQILEECKKDNLICFAGAQMKRESDNQRTNAPLLAMEYIRECSDFEQDAHLIIGLGRKENTRFYNVMKYRDEEYNDSLYIELDTSENGHFGYSYIQPAFSVNLSDKKILKRYSQPQKAEKPAGSSEIKNTIQNKKNNKSAYLQNLMFDNEED